MNYGGIYVIETNIIDRIGRQVTGLHKAKDAFCEECEKYFLNQLPSDAVVFLWQIYDFGETSLVSYMDYERWKMMKAS